MSLMALAKSVKNSAVFDYLQVFAFHLFDISTFNPFGMVFFPLYGFSSISAPSMQTEFETITPGNWLFPHDVVKSASVGDITLGRGTTWYESEFWKWYVNSLNGIEERKTLLLVHMTRFSIADNALTRIPAKAWVLYNVLPSSYKPASDFDGAQSDISLMDLTIKPEYWEEVGWIHLAKLGIDKLI